MKKIIFTICLLTSSLTFSQNNIINTLGANGSFIIKDDVNSFFSLNQSDGSISIPMTTTPSLGTIYKGIYPFIHDFAPKGSPSGNTFIGINSGNFTMTFGSGNEGSRNTAVGKSTLSSLTTGWDNTAIGFQSMISNTSGNRNTALGLAALYSNTTGVQNTAVGYNSLGLNTTGIQNTAVGNYALTSNITGQYNTAVGHFALLTNSSGSENTSVGHHSLQNNTGNYNTAIGFNAGSSVTSGFNLTLIGIDANPSTATAGDEITLGNTFVKTLRCAATSITSLSDKRDKKNIRDLNLGIDFLMKIKPREFNWDKREWYPGNKSDGSKMKEEPTAGFIAQELDSVQTSENAEWLKLVLKDNPEKLEATPGNLLPIIVKAIQDLKRENDNLKLANTQLLNSLNKFEKEQNALISEIDKLKKANNGTNKVSLGEQ